MADKIFSYRDGLLRVYDATGTPNYVVAKFLDTDLEMPRNPGRGDEELMLNQDKADSTIHYMKKSDKKIFEPVPFSFSGFLHDTSSHLLLIPALCGPEGGSGTWTVGSATTFVTVSSPGSRVNMEGTSVTCPLPRDVKKFLTNIEYLLDGDTTDFGRQMKACMVEEKDCQFSMASPCKFKISGIMYGIASKITSFTAGSEVTS